ncbi:MAG: hypothetical protein ABJF23_16415 [Bryobacteraceae bacterium]
MTNRLLILSIFAATSTASLFAQEPTKLKLDIPFSFHVGPSDLPAGRYTVQSGVVAKRVLTLRSESGHAINIGFIPNSTLFAPQEGKLVFSKYGDDYFLSQVYTPESTTIATLAKTPREFEWSAKGQPSNQTTLVARRK